MRLHSFALTLIALVSLVGSLKAQSVLHCLEDGMWLPVAEVRGKTPYCFTGDGVIKGKAEQLTLLPASDFGYGFVHVEVTANERKGVQQNDGILRFTSESSWYLLKAKLTAETDLEDAYYAMRFESYGRYTYYLHPIGDLKAGKTRPIEIFMKVGYELPQQLHIFSGMEEIRTSLVPTDYTYEEGSFVMAAR